MQDELDNRIIENKGLKGLDLIPNTFLALQVELAEFANEGRWFKHWSDRQTPRVEQEKCDYCGEYVDYTRPSPFMGESASMCKICWDMTKEEHAASNGEYIPDFEDYSHFKKKEPTKLLEEFVDCVHFFFSIANQKGWQDTLYIYEDQVDKGNYDGQTTSYYLELVYYLNKAYMEVYPVDDMIADFQKNAYYFRLSWILFLNIGINGFGFTLEQIEDAYVAKNVVNHQRQEQGY
jgi:dimeric dUTPase (all-alpha-NTP-PPase superfamily)